MDRKASGFWRYGDGSCMILWDFLEPFTRLWGVATSVVMCGVGVEMAVFHHVAGFYILIGAVVVFFLEIMWAITLFIELCTNHNEYTPALRCWDAVSCCRTGWKRAPLYVPSALALLLWPRWLWVARVAGGMLLALALFHIALSAGTRPRHPLLPNQHHHLVTDGASDCGDRYDDLTEVVDDSFPTPVNSASNHSAATTANVKEQNANIEI